MTTVTGVAADKGLAEVLDRLPADLERWHAPGVELAAVRGGETILAAGYGSADLESASPATAGTLFHHGSCGKAYTALLAALLEDDGLLDLDAPVRTYIPELRLPDPVIAERATLRDLLSHRSGLARHDMAWILNPSWSRQNIVERLAHLPLHGDLRAQMNYSNFGYALAGISIERAAGTSYEEQLRHRVFEPAGLTRTVSSSEIGGVTDDVAAPYVVRDGQAIRTEWRDMPTMAAAGGVISCAEDSVRWLQLQLGHGPIDVDIVRRTHHLHTPVAAELTTALPDMHIYGYALGWMVASLRGHRVLWHSGGIDGFTTYVLLLPDDDIGVVASVNLHLTQNLPLALVLDMADALLGEPSETFWTDRLFESPEETPPQQREGEPAPPTHALDAYVGTFANPGYGRLEVTLAKNALSFRLGDFTVTSSHRHFDTWDVNYQALDAKSTVTFITGADGTITEAVVTFEVEESGPIRYLRQPTSEGES